MKIPVLHLEDGLHHFEYSIRGGELKFSRSEVYPEAINVRAEINKFGKNIKCHVDLETMAHHICDRCLDNFILPYREQFELLFHVGTEDFETDEEDVVFITPETVEIDLSDWIIEYLLLTIPMKNVCHEECRGICPGCGVDLNREECRCEEAPLDPRLEKLRELLK